MAHSKNLSSARSAVLFAQSSSRRPSRSRSGAEIRADYAEGVIRLRGSEGARAQARAELRNVLAFYKPPGA